VNPKTGKKNVLGVLVDPIDQRTALECVDRAARDRKRCTISALAVHGVMTGALDRQHRARLNGLDLIVPDGQPVRWALNLMHGTKLAERVYGPDLMLAVCRLAARKGYPVYLYGSKAEVLERLSRNLLARAPDLKIAGKEASAFRRLTERERDQVLERIRSSGARIVFVGLGCPRQEVWAYENGGSLSCPVLAVGAAFDFHAGTLEQAPARLQRLGLEWLYRLSKEPRRLWRRYLILNPVYLTLLGLQATGLYAPDPECVSEAPEELRFG
jgi:N-acetylglucosaminyldiphosphoundecaprenol N-acetyl-beta-D-mannosaminyltransferase